MRIDAAILFLLAAAHPETPQAARWYTIVDEGGTRIGFASIEVARVGTDWRRTETREVTLAEEGGPWIRLAERAVILTSADGRVRSVQHVEQTGRAWTRRDIDISGDHADVVTNGSRGRGRMVVPLPAGTRFDGGEDLLRTWDPQRQPLLEFDDFDAGSATVDHVVVRPAAAEASDPPGSSAALRVRYEQGRIRGIARVIRGADGSLAGARQPMFGSAVTFMAANRAEALRPHAAYAALPRSLVKSPVRITPAALDGHIRYRFTPTAGLGFEPPETGEQAARVDGTDIILDVCRDCGPGLPDDAATLARARKPTEWLESEDPRIRAIADPVAHRTLPDAAKMALLLERARPFLEKVDFVGHYSAVETLKRRAGDCTEAAVLLAALGRAAGIPTLVASGLVYSREQYHGVANMFMPHSWTLAYVDGRWRSFDLALDSFDASHIALTVGDGDPRSIAAAGQLASLLKWGPIVEVRRPAG
jgi:hypothetical protein